MFWPTAPQLFTTSLVKLLSTAILILATTVAFHAWLTRPPRYLPTSLGVGDHAATIPLRFDTATGRVERPEGLSELLPAKAKSPGQ